MGIYATKSKWQNILNPIVTYCVRKGIHPDWFTYSAILISLISGVAFIGANRYRFVLWLVPPCLLLRLLFNVLDGQIARGMGLADLWGELKNEFGDRISDCLIFLGLVAGGYADARLAALSLALFLCSSYLGILSKALTGIRLYQGIFAKGDRMLSLALFTFYPLITANLGSYNVYLGFAAIATSITIIQRIGVIHGHS